MLHAQATNQSTLRLDEEARIVLLASAAAEGDEGAFSDLYDLLAPRVFNLVLRSVRDRPTAEDLCQEIWLRAHKEIRRLKAPEAVRSWLYRIASHACVDFARSSRGKHRGEEDNLDEFITSLGPQPEDSAILGSEVRMVWETLGSMAPRQSMALYLRQVDGLSYDEIASILDCSRATVEALLFRARQSFIRAYHRVESSPAERCEMFSEVMAGIIDDEPTALQRSALEAHAGDCRSCRAELAAARWADRAYLALPLLPLGQGLALETLLAGGATAAGGGLLSAAAGLLGVGSVPAKALLIGALLTAGGGAIATDHVGVPGSPDRIIAYFSGSSATDGESTAVTSPPAGITGRVTSTQTLPSHLQTELGTMNGGPSDPTGASAITSPSSQAAGVKQEDREQTGPAATVAANAAPGTTPPATSSASGGNPAPSQEAAGATPEPGGSPAPDAPPAQGGGPSATPTPPTLPGALGETGEALETVTTNTLNAVTDLAGETLNNTAVLAGDTTNALVAPVTTVIAPVDNAVEGLTGLSVGETLDDVTNVLPSSNATPVPLNETIEDVVEPVVGLLENPVQPVQDLLEDPLAPVEDLTGPLLGPLLPTPAPPTPQPAMTQQPGASPTQEPASTPEDGLCLLGLLFC